MQSFSRSVTQGTRHLRRFAGAALALAGVGGFGYMIKRQMEVIDTTAKLSDRINISTEALIGLQHGAQISGVETETLNKSLEIAQGLRRQGISADVDLLRRGMSKSLKYASSINADKIVIVGPKELEKDSVIIRDMESGDQRMVKIKDLCQEMTR